MPLPILCVYANAIFSSILDSNRPVRDTSEVRGFHPKLPLQENPKLPENAGT